MVPFEQQHTKPHTFTMKLSPSTKILFHLNIPVTVKVLNFRTPENFAVINLKFKQRGQSLGYFIKKDANGKANSEDPDQTAPLGAV